MKEHESSTSERDVTRDYVALATCERCRKDGGCFNRFRATSSVPLPRQFDAELFVSRNELYRLMRPNAQGVRIIEFSEVGGKRLVDGASKCRYYSANKNKAVGERGGYRRGDVDVDAAAPEQTEPASEPSQQIEHPPVEKIEPPLAPPPPPVEASKHNPSPPADTEKKTESLAKDASAEKLALLESMPQPPHRSNGHIKWDEVPDALLERLLKFLSPQEIAEAWGVTRGAVNQIIAKRRAQGHLAGPAAGARIRYEKPRKLWLFEHLWLEPLPHIAERLKVGDHTPEQGTILNWADTYGLTGEFRPGTGYWQKKKNGIVVVVPTAVKKLYQKVRSEAAPEELTGDIPEIFELTEAERAGEVVTRKFAAHDATESSP